MKAPFFSVVVTAYNCEQYILETLESIRSQTFNDYEVVIIDDASTDQTGKLITEFIEDRGRWTLYTNTVNIGAARSRNKGFCLARGEYIAILDGDDVWCSEKLSKQYDALINHNVQLCYTSYSFINEKSKRYNKAYITKPNATYKMLLRENIIGCSTVVFDAVLAKQYQMDPAIGHEDYLFWLQVLKDGYSVFGILDPLVDYRIHPRSRSFRKLKSAMNRFVIYYKTLKLGFVKSCIYFVCYAINGTLKYIRLL